uniref:Uncharacterized protein n=1 Tax=Myoviridae sp. ctiv53 TaxID=2827703 RepID=A0A8S5THP2_9CAUD|nr:MAG TPA: hypothetical protein [Myoviridae sp. ctiv53]
MFPNTKTRSALSGFCCIFGLGFVLHFMACSTFLHFAA